MVIKIRVEDHGDLRRVTRGLSKLEDGKRLRREFTKGVRSEVRPVANRLRAAYLANPSKDQPNPRGRMDLRKLLARAVRIEVRTSGRNPGVIIRVDGRRMPDRMGGVPAAYEGNKRWRHPVGGNRNVWVTQDPQPTFDRVVRASAPGVRRRVNRIAEGLAREVTKG